MWGADKGLSCTEGWGGECVFVCVWEGACLHSAGGCECVWQLERLPLVGGGVVRHWIAKPVTKAVRNR